MNVKNKIAKARGCTVFATTAMQCQICGESAFESAGPTKKVLSASFTGFSLMHPGLEICKGCQMLLSGKPGCKPPPLRMISFTVVGGELKELTRDQFWEMLNNPPNGDHILSWATSKKIHHWQHAGLSTKAMQLIGSDSQTIEHDVQECTALRNAVHSMLEIDGKKPVFSRSAIESGDYHPKAVAKYGIADWQKNEQIIKQFRPSALLSLLCWCAPAEEVGGERSEQLSLTETEAQAVELLADLAEASELRRSDGKAFWSGVLQHRLNRVGQMPLKDAVSRLIDWLDINPISTGAQTSVKSVAEWDQNQCADISAVLHRRSNFIVVLALQAIKERRAK